MPTEGTADRAPLPETTTTETESGKGSNSGRGERPEQKDLFVRAQRRKLSDERKSITHKFTVGGQEGYIIVGMYREGTPGEIFIKMAKEGSTLSGFMDGLALSISIGLQYGVPLRTIVDKLMNTRFEPSGYTENPDIRYSTSVLDYIARWLASRFLAPEYLKPRALLDDATQVTGKLSGTMAGPGSPEKQSLAGAVAPSCSLCGMLMTPNGSCYQCGNCGFTSGCS